MLWVYRVLALGFLSPALIFLANHVSIPGFTTRITSTGIGVRTLHYSADSRKRPATVAGNAWVAEEARAYPLGTEDPRWLKEMEIKYGALGGNYLFPRWERWKAEGNIVIGPFEPIGYRLYASYDHGWSNPAAFHVHGMDSDGRFVIGLWEFYATRVPSHLIAQLIQGHDIRTEDGRFFRGCPFAGQWSFIIADPSIWAEDLPQHNGPNKATAAIYRDCGVSMIPGERGGDKTVAEWLHGHFWKDPKAPLLRVACPSDMLDKHPKEYCGPGAPMLTWEIGQQRDKEYSAAVALTRNQPDELVDKDNHAWDGMKYFLKRFPPAPLAKRAEQIPNTFNWWKKQLQRSQAGQTPRTFRVGQ